MLAAQRRGRGLVRLRGIVDALRHAQAFVIFGQIAARRAAQRYRHRLGDASERARSFSSQRGAFTLYGSHTPVEVGQAAARSATLPECGREGSLRRRRW